MAFWQPSKLTVYLVAGVATYPSTFQECRRMLDRLFGEQGTEATMEVLFPYGDYSRKLWRQVWEVRSDLTRLLLPSRIGARAMIRDLERSYTGGPVLLLGHSGGGVAACRAARLLLEQGISADDIRVVQIGSPRVPVPDELQESSAYFYALDGRGRPDDPVTRLGSWGGWLRLPGGIPAWNRMRYAPGYVRGLPVIGGHTNYFRHQLPYVDGDSRSNLDKTIGAVADWLKGDLPSVKLQKGK